MEYLNFLDLGVLTCCWVSARPRVKNQLLLCQRSNFNQWAQSAYLLDPIGGGIFYSVLRVVHILDFFTDLWIGGLLNIGGPGCSPVSTLLNPPLRTWRSETFFSIFWGFIHLEKVARCTIIHLLFSEASFQPSVRFLRACLVSVV